MEINKQYIERKGFQSVMSRNELVVDKSVSGRYPSFQTSYNRLHQTDLNFLCNCKLISIARKLLTFLEVT